MPFEQRPDTRLILTFLALNPGLHLHHHVYNKPFNGMDTDCALAIDSGLSQALL